MPSWDEIEREAEALVDAAERRGAVLRVVGSTAIRLRSADAAALMDAAQRKAKDIDLICRREDRGVVREVLEERGYEVDRDMLVAMEGTRYAFAHPATAMDIDLFVDRLEFCHTLDLRARLEGHPATIALEDLLLQKLQIVEMTRGDLVDTLVLLTMHDVSEDRAPGSVDAAYIAGLLGSDWGFHKTVTRNLERIRDIAATAPPEGLGDGRVAAAGERASRLLAAIEGHRKSMGWRVRARVGERAQWWQDVHDHRESY